MNFIPDFIFPYKEDPIAHFQTLFIKNEFSKETLTHKGILKELNHFLLENSKENRWDGMTRKLSDMFDNILEEFFFNSFLECPISLFKNQLGTFAMLYDDCFIYDLQKIFFIE